MHSRIVKHPAKAAVVSAGWLFINWMVIWWTPSVRLRERADFTSQSNMPATKDSAYQQNLSEIMQRWMIAAMTLWSVITLPYRDLNGSLVDLPLKLYKYNLMLIQVFFHVPNQKPHNWARLLSQQWDSCFPNIRLESIVGSMHVSLQLIVPWQQRRLSFVYLRADNK